MNFHTSKLIRLKAKGNKWYVQVTKPLGLQAGKDKQIRRSTGTTDRKQAERSEHRIAQQIYAEFDRQLDELKPQPPVKFTFLTGPPDPLFNFRPRPEIPKQDPAMRLSRVRPQYINERNWNREKTKNGANGHIQEFISVVGDIYPRPQSCIQKRYRHSANAL